MTSEAAGVRLERGGRFPVGLTIAAGLVFALCVALGVWQVHRFDWKQRELARIAALQSEQPQPIGQVLARAARGEDVSFTRVVANCAPGTTELGQGYIGSIDAGDWAWRPTAICRLTAPPYDSIAIVRGNLDVAKGTTEVPKVVLPQPRRVIGVLRANGPKPMETVGNYAPYFVDAEREIPSVPGISPSQFTAQAPGNLQYVGAYAPTWFGLAGVVAGVYAAMLWRRLRP